MGMEWDGKEIVCGKDEYGFRFSATSTLSCLPSSAGIFSFSLIPSLLVPGKYECHVQAAVREWARVRSCPSADMGCRRNTFFPAGIMFNVTG